MKLIRNSRQKMYTTLLLSCVLGLILWNNIAERNNILSLQKSFYALYEDRLVAENYVFQLSENLHRKLRLMENAAELPAGLEENITLNKNIEELNSLFASTHLTIEEGELFESYCGKIKGLLALESKMNLPLDDEPDAVAQVLTFKKELVTCLILLSQLSEIQIQEGKKIIDESKTRIDGSNLSSELEMALVIIIALIIQVLIFSFKPIISPIEQKSSLN